MEAKVITQVPLQNGHTIRCTLELTAAVTDEQPGCLADLTQIVSRVNSAILDSDQQATPAITNNSGHALQDAHFITLNLFLSRQDREVKLFLQPDTTMSEVKDAVANYLQVSRNAITLMGNVACLDGEFSAQRFGLKDGDFIDVDEHGHDVDIIDMTSDQGR